jgi:hypothetical protein
MVKVCRGFIGQEPWPSHRPMRCWDLLDDGLQQAIAERLFDLCKPTWDKEGTKEIVDYESVNALMQSSRSLRVIVSRLISAAKIEVW